MSPTHKGKIGSLPATIREEVNRRLHNGQTGPEICAWLNADSEVLKILDEKWNEQPVSPQNLSEWRKGGYQTHLNRIARNDHLKTLTNWAVTISDEIPVEKYTGAAQRILAGQLLDKIESMEEGQALALIEALGDLTLSVDRTQKNEIARDKVALTKQQIELRNKEVDLNRDKFETQTVEKFLNWQGTEEARNILESGKPRHIQAEQLRELFFGPIPANKVSPS